MSHTDPYAVSHSRRLLATVAIVAAAASTVFALGRRPEAGKSAHLAAPVPAAPSAGRAAGPAHDDSLPDTADTLSHERLRDEDPAPTF